MYGVNRMSKKYSPELLKANQNMVEDLLETSIDPKKPLTKKHKEKLYALIVTRCKGTELEQPAKDLYTSIIEALKESEK